MVLLRIMKPPNYISKNDGTGLSARLTRQRPRRNALRFLGETILLSGGSPAAENGNVEEVVQDNSNFTGAGNTERQRISSDELREWMRDHGVSFEKLELRHSPVTGTSIFAREDIPANSTLCTVPAKLCLTVDMADKAHVLAESWEMAFGGKESRLSEGLDLISHEESSHVRFWILLCALRRIHVYPEKLTQIEEAELKSSVDSITAAVSGGEGMQRIDFGPYLRSLPEKHSDPLWWSNEGVELLRGTNLYDTILRTRKGAMMLYEQLRSHFVKHFPILRNGFTYSEFIWGWSTHRSRCFSGQSLLGGNQFFMIPCLDLCNHELNSDLDWVSNVTDRKSILGSHAALSYFTTYKISKGQEVFNSYGSKGNDILLNSYGFVEPHNVLERIPLDITVNLSDTGQFSKFKREAVERGERFSQQIQGKLTTLQKLKLLDLPDPFDYFLPEDICPIKPPPSTDFGEIDHKMDGLASERTDLITEVRGLEWVLVAYKRVLAKLLLTRHMNIELREDYPFSFFEDWLKSNKSLQLVQATGASPYECWAAETYVNRHMHSIRKNIRDTNRRLSRARQGLANIEEAFECKIFPKRPQKSNIASHVSGTKTFLRWIANNGGWIHSCFGSDNEGARSHPNGGDVLVEIPATAVMSSNSIFTSKSFRRKLDTLTVGVHAKLRAFTERDLLTLFLIHERFENGEKSDYWPVVSLMQDPNDLPYKTIIEDISSGPISDLENEKTFSKGSRQRTSGFADLKKTLTSITESDIRKQRTTDTTATTPNLGKDKKDKSDDGLSMYEDLPLTIQCSLARSLKPLLTEYQRTMLPFFSEAPMEFPKEIYSLSNYIWATKIVDSCSKRLLSPLSRTPKENSMTQKLLLLPFPPLMAENTGGDIIYFDGYPCAEWNASGYDRDPAQSTILRQERARESMGEGILRFRMRVRFSLPSEYMHENPLCTPASCERGIPFDNSRQFLFFSRIIPNLLNDFIEIPIEDVLYRFFDLDPNVISKTSTSAKAWLLAEHQKRVSNYSVHLLRRWSGGSPMSHALLELFEICQLTPNEADRIKLRGLDAIYPRPKTWWALADYLGGLLHDCTSASILGKQNFPRFLTLGFDTLLAEHAKILKFAQASVTRHLEVFGRTLSHKWFMGCNKCQENSVIKLADGTSGLLYNRRGTVNDQGKNLDNGKIGVNMDEMVNITSDWLVCEKCESEKSSGLGVQSRVNSARQPSIWRYQSKC